jgi:hypothetical protein
MSIHAGHRRTVLLVLFLSTFLILAASAACPETKLKVLPSNVVIDNPGAIEPGAAVVMSVRVDFPDKENTTYPDTSQLELTSGLDNPAWTRYIIRDGVKRPETEERKSRVVISGGDLAYPANTSVSLKIELYGIAPPVMENRNLTVMRIQDIAGTACVNEPVYQYNAWVLNTTITRERISGLYAELARLRAFTTAKNKAGTNTTAIMDKFDEAERSLDEANSTPVFEFVSVGLALNRTETAIDEGKRLLDQTPYGNIVVEQGRTTIRNEEPVSPQKTPVSPGLAPVLTGIIACFGVAIFLSQRNRE